MNESMLIVGGGAMGAGIAAVAALAGFGVELAEPDAGARARAAEQIRRAGERAGDPAALGRVRMTTAIPAQSQAPLAIEAVPERLDLKRNVVQALGRALAADALIATNTSSLAVGEIAEGVVHPERVVGMHFFNPATAMQLVEIVRADGTSDDAVAAALDIAQRLGKTPVLAADTPGFIVNRVARPYYLQALRALERGVASVEELDELARGAGFRMGPFRLMDLIGIDVNLATSDSVYARTEAARLEPVATQREMVAQGRLGRKSGSGFYDYGDGAQESEPRVPAGFDERNADEHVVVIGYSGAAAELLELLAQHYEHVTNVERDDAIDEISTAATIVIDMGDGTSDRRDVLRALDELLPPETVLFTDAYATDVTACANAMRHGERLVGYGVLGELSAQSVVEIADSHAVSDDALALAQELFEALGKRVTLVDDVPGLFLGRTVGSIVNEAVIAVQEGVATSDDVDTAMRLGTNYPIGPIAWGREIGGARIARILHRLAENENPAFAPHRALWVLDLDQEEAQPDISLEGPVL